MRILLFLSTIVAVLAAALWNLWPGPEEHFQRQIQGSVVFPDNAAIGEVTDERDLRERGIRTLVPNVPAQDEILLQEDLGRAFVAAMDGYIWIVDLQRNRAEPFVKTPLMPGGMVADPTNPDLVYFCLSRGKAYDPIADNGPGIYELQISTKSIRKIATRVPGKPKTAARRSDGKSSIGKLYASGHQPVLRVDEMTDANSRPVEKADDLAISRDGQRIYFTEPYDHPGAILGVSTQSRNEALSLGTNGNIWMLDLATNSVALVAHDYAYLDGILLEYAPGQSRETSILVNELSKFRLLRLHLTGASAGADEVVIDGLPGFPDGMDRDPQGRVWVALVFERSALITWLHKHPFWKRLALYIPRSLQPAPRRTALIVLSPDGTQPLYYGVHDGSLFSALIVVVPGKERAFLAVYQQGYRGLNVMPYPL